DHLQGYFVLGRVALWVVMLSAVASAIDYYRRFNRTPVPRMDAGPADSHGGGQARG
ncbi:MAG: hypothetical protein IMZ55_03670, partial [Acidobacteria bacterium]|nr:hypothetical protein [Acidobacteriota bacterium]